MEKVLLLLFVVTNVCSQQATFKGKLLNAKTKWNALDQNHLF